jgi:hypothetical protein
MVATSSNHRDRVQLSSTRRRVLPVKTTTTKIDRKNCRLVRSVRGDSRVEKAGIAEFEDAKKQYPFDRQTAVADGRKTLAGLSLARRASWSSEPVTTIARHAPRPVALANFHESATARRFTLAPRNLDPAPKVVTLGSVRLQH